MSDTVKLLRHPVAGLVIFSILIGLFIQIYTGFETNYDITKGDIQNINGTQGNIVDQLKELPIIKGVSQIQTAIDDTKVPTASSYDIAGALISVGVGVIKTILGLITMPYSLTNIIVTFYAGEIPGVIAGLTMLVIVYASFILISAYLRSDI